ncbi:aminotransferase class III-fold pyridoxal phosphate-dependent enzyme [Saccharothrix sp. S26]|uniref:aspartate aminotransferase family protein n=1 Tax=Saccharothrix sp. S26 TaxID=2907215 RepID=UPI001F1C5A6A|nr:aminotransferase class III-fold pyridoxal phosphate-dependent enzyme [Saccharothrix sp. S26]MCE6999008.1 aminotransferase class III-fold pyridoxal phosphate-dependent enzyme [Saccharothrix sp. S26]
MNPVVDKPELAEPYMFGWLDSLGLGVEYTRSKKDSLFRRDASGAEVEVLDLVGGYGSTIHGHNNPEIIEFTKSLLDSDSPIHAQFSRHPYANDLAWTLNTILRRELGTDENYQVIFANSGAEANEVAIKHAEMDRVLKIGEALAEVEAHIEAAVAAAAAGATVDASPLSGSTIDEVVAALRAANTERAATSPVYLAPNGSFHGKLAGSIQLTHNVSYRTPFSAMAAQCRFLPLEPDAVAEAIAAENRTLFDLAVDGGVIRVVERPLPVVSAFILEPIQGEAGIRVLDADALARVREVLDAAGIRVIVDEVQSGMGRSGAFFAASHLGLRGDYITLAKSLGGGVAKAAVTMIRSSIYRTDFELLHTSTYAKDSFSTLIASKAVDMLEADGGAAYRKAAERGDKLLAMLNSLREEFGDVVKDVRGKGLMTGLEFHDLSDSEDDILAEQAKGGLIGYMFSGYLLREHNMRVFPTASATSTLRFEPSIHITDEEIARTEAGLRGLIGLIQAGDGKALLG